MKPIILISIDGLGIGQIEGEEKCNTWKTLFKKTKTNELSFFKSILHNSQKLFLDYSGADSFLGHLRMSGINTNKISLNPLKLYKDKILKLLKEKGYQAKYEKGIIVAENKFIIYDNFEAEHGLAINVAGSLDEIKFEKQLNISREIRKIVTNPRLISFGAKKVSINDFLRCHIQEGEFYGIETPKTGVYNSTFKVKHFPIQTSLLESIQHKLSIKDFKVYLYGKFGDIINLESKNIFKYENIKVKFIFKKLKDNLFENTFHNINIQQTDLYGHEGNANKMIQVLKELEENIKNLDLNNIHLIVTADHGNDPAVKIGKHTREYVPFWSNDNLYNINNLSEVATYIEHLVEKFKI